MSLVSCSEIAVIGARIGEDLIRMSTEVPKRTNRNKGSQHQSSTIVFREEHVVYWGESVLISKMFIIGISLHIIPYFLGEGIT